MFTINRAVDFNNTSLFLDVEESLVIPYKT